MKKLLVMLVVVLSVAALFYACGSSSSSTPKSNAVTFSSPNQAAASASSVSGAVSLTATVSTATGLAGGAIPAGYAPKRLKAIDTSAIANLDPRLKTVVDKMLADLRKPALVNAMAKSRALKPSSAPLSSAVISSTTFSCGYSGSFTISGQDNSTTSYDDHTVDVAFNNCRDMSGTTYDIMSGSMHAHHKQMLDGSSDIADVRLTDFALSMYSGGALSGSDVLNGTFNSTDNVTDGSDSANGSFVMSSGGTDMTFSFSNISDAWTKTTATLSSTEEHVANGAFGFSIVYSPTSTYTFNISMSNMTDKVQTNTSDSSRDEWIDGGISLSWSSVYPGTYCLPGSLTVSTDANYPIHTPVSFSCPTGGKATLNGATIEFGKPSGTQVTVTVNGTPQVFTDCNSMGGGC